MKKDKKTAKTDAPAGEETIRRARKSSRRAKAYPRARRNVQDYGDLRVEPLPRR